MIALDLPRERLTDRIGVHIDKAIRDLPPVNRWVSDVLERLRVFLREGKMIRGSLVALGYRIGSKSERAPVGETGVPDGVLDAGAAMELLQAGLLIHDDIMDRDTNRRGMPSFYWQYAERARHAGLADHIHHGESIAMCAGDVAFFMAFEILGASGLGPQGVAFCCREMMLVGFAQMQDVWSGASADLPSEDEIMDLYRLKTGRYSFSLPLAIGAMLAGGSGPEAGRLAELGEVIGILFQIRDDELGLLGNPEETGKPVGNDIREGKKTLLWRTIRESAGDPERGRLDRILGSAMAGESETAFVRRVFETGPARERLRAVEQTLRCRAEDLIESLETSGECRGKLLDLLDYVSARSK